MLKAQRGLSSAISKPSSYYSSTVSRKSPSLGHRSPAPAIEAYRSQRDNYLQSIVSPSPVNRSVRVDRNSGAENLELSQPNSIPEVSSPYSYYPSGINSIPRNASLSPAAPVVASVWQLKITPFSLNSFPDSMVGFYRSTDLQLPGRIEKWDSWATGILHTIYSKLCALPGKVSMFDPYIIYVRADRRIMVRELSYSGSENERTLKFVVEQLNGSPLLDFPTPLLDDTVFISGQIAYRPVQVERDVWGRPVARAIDNRSRYSW